MGPVGGQAPAEPLLGPIDENLDLLEGDHAFGDHLVEPRQDYLERGALIGNLDHDRKVGREVEAVALVQDAVSAKALDAELACARPLVYSPGSGARASQPE